MSNQNLEHKQIELIYRLNCELTNFTSEYIILAVDLNIQFDKVNKISHDNFKGKVIELTDNEEQTETISDKNPEKSLFTWHNTKHKTRTDCIFN